MIWMNITILDSLVTAPTDAYFVVAQPRSIIHDIENRNTIYLVAVIVFQVPLGVMVMMMTTWYPKSTQCTTTATTTTPTPEEYKLTHHHHPQPRTGCCQ